MRCDNQAIPLLHTPAYKRLRWAGYAEGVSFLVLLGIAMPLKYLAGKPEAVRFVGSVHGALFIAYLLTVALAARRFRWKSTTVVLAVASAVIPLGPFWFDAKLRRENTH